MKERVQNVDMNVEYIVLVNMYSTASALLDSISLTSHSFLECVQTVSSQNCWLHANICVSNQYDSTPIARSSCMQSLPTERWMSQRFIRSQAIGTKSNANYIT